MKIIKKYLDGGEIEERWLDGITVKPAGNRPTTREDWNWANWRELQNKREQQAAESVRRGIDRNGTPIAAGIYALAAAPFAIEGLGSSAVTNEVRTGLQAMNTFFTPSTWLNPVTGTRLLSPTVGTVADAGVQGTFTYKGLNGLKEQIQNGTLTKDLDKTVLNTIAVLPLVQPLSYGARNLFNSIRKGPQAITQEISKLEFAPTNNNISKVNATKESSSNFTGSDKKFERFMTKVKDRLHLEEDNSPESFNSIFSDPQKYLTPEEQNIFNDLDIDPQALKENLRYLQSLGQETYYHKALNTKQRLQEIVKMARPEQPIHIDKTTIGDFYTNDVWPRLLRNIKEQGLYLNPQEEQEIFSMFKEPWKGVDMKFGYTQPGSGGYSRGPNYIRFAYGEQPSNATVVHELHHSLRQRLTNWFNENFTNLAEPKDVYDWLRSTDKSRLQEQLNLPQYTKGELDAMKQFLFKPETRASLTPTREIGATFAETRFDLRNQLINNRKWYDKIYRRIRKKPMATVEETDQYINNFENPRIALMRHGYGNDILSDSWNHYRTNEPNVSEQNLRAYFNNWIKNSLNKIAGFGIPITIGTYRNRDSDEINQ